ncbi:MAG: PilX N-terminal domain-containing pilus assembly protein [Candidatus Acidiferrales bacterium]
MKNRQDKGMALITSLLVLLLTSSMIVGLAWLTMTDQKLGGNNNDRQLAFYGAESGMETLTARLENEFNSNYAPTATDINNLQLNPPANVPGVKYLAPGSTTNGSGFTIAFNKNAAGNPQSNNGTITTGQYSGLVSLNTPYTLTVTAHTPYGSEVKLQRVVQTVGIPVFEFGVFSQTDLAFFAGPNFNFGGRVHTNGNLWLAEGSGNALTLSDKVTAAQEIITTTLENGWPRTTNPSYTYTGTVNITTGSGTADLTAQNPAQSIAGTTWSTPTLLAAESASPVTYVYNGGAPPNFTSLASGTYNGKIGVKETGVKPLNLAIATAGVGGQPIDLIRRPVNGENLSNPNELAERFYGNQQTSLRILLSDYGSNGTCATSDISSTSSVALPGLTSTAPVDLATLAWDTTLPGSVYTAAPGWVTNAGVTVFPLPVSGAKLTTGYTSTDGYWIKTGYPIITGCIKIEYQDTSNGWHDITETVLNLGYTGRNINPQIGSALVPTCNAADNCPATAGAVGVNEPNLSAISTYGAANAKQVAASGPTANTGVTTVGCADPSPNAVIRLARLRDNASTAVAGNNFCGNNPSKGGAGLWYTSGTNQSAATCTTAGSSPNCPSQHGTDYWPSVLFDTREALQRDQAIAGLPVAGAMYYVELDVANLAKCLKGTIATCAANITNIQNTTGYAVYFSDRRGEQKDPSPPASVGGTSALTGGFGYEDFVNPGASGCPNGGLDTGEDVESDYANGISLTPTTLRTYGNILNPPGGGGLPANLWPIPGNAGTQLGTVSNLISSILKSSPPNCPLLGTTWPFAVANQAGDLRENPPIFFRRALKLVDGSLINANIGTCNTVPCGLTIASENPVYVQGDYNNNPNTDSNLSTPSADPHVGASIVADAVTLLSDNWNDVNSFAFPYTPGNRSGVTTTYRVAVAAGKGIPFQRTATFGAYPTPPQDFGTDGGVHNFLRFLEGWNGSLFYTGSIVSIFYNHQAVGVYKCCSTVYSAPTRGYNFDKDFLTPALLPPETPMLRDINAIGFTQMILPTQ